jgi:hypothetical protein
MSHLWKLFVLKRWTEGIYETTIRDIVRALRKRKSKHEEPWLTESEKNCIDRCWEYELERQHDWFLKCAERYTREALWKR